MRIAIFPVPEVRPVSCAPLYGLSQSSKPMRLNRRSNSSSVPSESSASVFFLPMLIFCTEGSRPCFIMKSIICSGIIPAGTLECLQSISFHFPLPLNTSFVPLERNTSYSVLRASISILANDILSSGNALFIKLPAEAGSLLLERSFVFCQKRHRCEYYKDCGGDACFDKSVFFKKRINRHSR